MSRKDLYERLMEKGISISKLVTDSMGLTYRIKTIFRWRLVDDTVTRALRETKNSEQFIGFYRDYALTMEIKPIEPDFRRIASQLRKYGLE